MRGLLIWLFVVVLKLKREIQICWALAQARLTPWGTTPGLCVCGYGLDDHSVEGECPIGQVEEIWAIDYDEDWDEDDDSGGGSR